ncbi:hypothetical protein BGX27_007756 [Mortierella sp. AM989]|nr:hypothetical protein BGX27_007756 [Mortierella sp. AM989]
MPTPKMTIHFDEFLNQVVTPITFTEPSIDDAATMRAVRRCLNGDMQRELDVKADRPDIVAKGKAKRYYLEKSQDYLKSTVKPRTSGVSGTYLRLKYKTRGMYISEEVGGFVTPTTMAVIPALVGTIPTLIVAKDEMGQLLRTSGQKRRSWGFEDIQNLKND